MALYDDTAVKNRYRMPIGVMVVIDSEYRTRIVGQSITADTTTDTFVWMLKCALESRGGKQPAIFIQDADAAMTGAVGQVFPDAQPRRCLWHLDQNITKALAKVLGEEMNVRVEFTAHYRYMVKIVLGYSASPRLLHRLRLIIHACVSLNRGAWLSSTGLHGRVQVCTPAVVVGEVRG